MKTDKKVVASAIANIVPGLMSGVELEFFAKNNITSSQLVTIMTVFHAERCMMSYLAETLYVKMPTVTGLIDRLVKLRLVRRIPSRDDRRKVYIELSEKGMDVISGFKGLVRRRWTKLLAALDSSEAKELRRLFEKIHQAIEDQRDAKK